MLVKNPKPASRKWIKRGAITFFVVEAVAFAFSYGVWHRANTDRDTRKYLKDNYPSILEGYYKTGEFLGASSRIRETDTAYWNASKQTAETALMSSPSRLIKSIFWLTAFSGLGFTLFVATTQTDDEYKKIGKELPGVNKKSKEVHDKNQQFMNVLQSATESTKPLYRLNKEEIKKSVDK